MNFRFLVRCTKLARFPRSAHAESATHNPLPSETWQFSEEGAGTVDWASLAPELSINGHLENYLRIADDIKQDTPRTIISITPSRGRG
jgi:hypothetical protein